MNSNQYRDRMAADLRLCRPLVSGSAIEATVAHAGDILASRGQGDGARPVVTVDLEQFQVVDYAAFEDVNDDQRSKLLALHGKPPASLASPKCRFQEGCWHAAKRESQQNRTDYPLKKATDVCLEYPRKIVLRRHDDLGHFQLDADQQDA